MFKFNDTFMKCIMANLKNNLIPMLLGEPGIGKSSFVMELESRLHTKCFVFPCNQLADKADVTGARLVPVTVNVKQADGSVIQETTYQQVFYPHQIIQTAIQYAIDHPRETPILFMDELNRTTPDVTSECLSIPTLRKIGSVDIPKNLRVITAGNDKGNVVSLDEASVSRFVLYHVEPDLSTFLRVNPNLNIFVKNILQANPGLLFCKRTNDVVVANGQKKDDDDEDMSNAMEILGVEEMNQFTTPRTLSALSDFLNSFTNKELIQMLAETTVVDGQPVSILQEAVEGHVGHTMFSITLMSELATKLMTTNNQTNTLTIQKPAVYDQMKACTTMTDMNALIATMTDNDKSACLAYMLYDHTDNSVLINALAPSMTKMNNNDVSMLFACVQSGELDTENLNVLAASNTPIATSLSLIIQMA